MSSYNDDYSYKYLEYKTKYLNLINNQTGGVRDIKDIKDVKSLKIFDLSKNHNFGSDVQKNLDVLYSKFGKKFIIKFNEIKVPVILTKITILANNKNFYTMFYDIKYKTNSLYPFKIDFIDKHTLDISNNSFIANIHKTDEISGSNMVLLVLEINRILNVKKTSLGDGTTIRCGDKEYDLSYLKLIEKGITFYMKFGFDFDVSNCQWYYERFLNKKDLLNRLEKILKNIRHIQIKDIINEYETLLDIISCVIKEQNEKKLDIVFRYTDVIKETNLENEHHKEKPEASIEDMFRECNNVLKILHHTKHKYLYKYMIELFNDKDKCINYGILYDSIIANTKYKIKYGKKEIIREYTSWFRTLMNIRYEFFSYEFK